MDLATRKYNFIRALVNIDKESIIEELEQILIREKEVHQKISVSHKKELDNRLESYQKNPDDLLDWEEVKKNW